MFTEETRGLITEAIEEGGWLTKRDIDRKIENAKEIVNKAATPH